MGSAAEGPAVSFGLQQSQQFARGYNCERRWWGEMKIRPLLIVLSLSALPVAASAQEQCPQFSGPARVRLELQARWLVSDSLQKQIAARSSAFGQLIAFERCHILQSNLLSDQVTEEEGPFFVADNVPLKSRVGTLSADLDDGDRTYRANWQVTQCQCPENNRPQVDPPES